MLHFFDEPGPVWLTAVPKCQNELHTEWATRMHEVQFYTV